MAQDDGAREALTTASEAVTEAVTEAQVLAMPGRRSVLANAMHLLYSQAITWILALVIATIQPRLLGPDGQGLIRLAFSLWTIAQVFIGLGTSNLLTLEIARDREQGASIFGPVLTLRLLGFTVSTAAIFGFAIVTGATRQTFVVLALIGFSTLATSLGLAARYALMGFERMGFTAVADVAAKVIQTIGVILVLVGGGGVEGVAACFLAAGLLNALMMFRFLRRFPGCRFRPTLGGSRRILHLSVGFLVAEATLIIYQQVDTIVLAALVDKRELGWYATSDTLFASFLFIPSILLSSLFPVIGRLHVEDPARLRKLVERSFASLLVVGVPIGLGTMVIGAPLALLVYGERFRQAGQILSVLGLVIILVFVTILFGFVAVGTGRQRFWNTVMIVAIVASVPLDIVLVPWMERRHHNGAIGGALSYLITEGFMTVMGLWKIAPQVMSRSSLVRTGKILLAGALMTLASWPWRERLLLIPVGVGAVVYVACIMALRVLTDDELLRARALVARATGGRLAGASRGGRG